MLAIWAGLVRLIAAVLVPVGGFMVAGLGGAFLAVLTAWSLVEFILGPAAFLALRRSGRDPFDHWMIGIQGRRHRYQRRLVRLGIDPSPR